MFSCFLSCSYWVGLVRLLVAVGDKREALSLLVSLRDITLFTEYAGYLLTDLEDWKLLLMVGALHGFYLVFLPETETVDSIKGCHAKQYLKASVTPRWEVLYGLKFVPFCSPFHATSNDILFSQNQNFLFFGCKACKPWTTIRCFDQISLRPHNFSLGGAWILKFAPLCCPFHAVLQWWAVSQKPLFGRKLWTPSVLSKSLSAHITGRCYEAEV